jgi:hypothetical protein
MSCGKTPTELKGRWTAKYIVGETLGRLGQYSPEVI